MSVKYKVFSITGTLSNMTRDQAEAAIKSRGGFFSLTPSYGTNYLVVGDKPGAAKLKAAQSKGAKIIDEEAFNKLLKGEELVAVKPTPIPVKPVVPAPPPEPPKPKTPMMFEVREW